MYSISTKSHSFYNGYRIVQYKHFHAKKEQNGKL